MGLSSIDDGSSTSEERTQSPLTIEHRGKDIQSCNTQLHRRGTIQGVCHKGEDKCKPCGEKLEEKDLGSLKKLKTPLS
jgi:hypothetical protein